MNKEYKLIGNFIDELKSTQKIRLDKSEFRFYSESVNEHLLNKLKGIKVAETILEFYRQVDFVNIQWHLAEDAGLEFIDKEMDIVEGRLDIPPFSSLVGNILNPNNQQLIDPYHNLGEADYAALNNYFPFDLLNGNGAVCFRLQNSVINDELHYISIGNESFIKPLNVDIESYLNKGYEYYFFINWQKAAFTGDSSSKKLINFYLNQLKK